MPPTVAPGRIDVTTRALVRTVTAISAARLGVPVREVSVVLSDDGGNLGVQVAAPAALPGLRSATGAPTGLVTHAQEVRADIRESIVRMTDRRVGALSLNITRAVIAPTRRVK